MTVDLVQLTKTRFAEMMDLDPEKIDMNARLDDAYGVTSMNSMRLVSGMEIELGIDVAEEDLEAIRCLNDVVGLCQRHLSAKAEGA